MVTEPHLVRPFERFPNVMCPGCKVAMTLEEMHPILCTGDVYTATYRCRECSTKTKREFKRDNDWH
jgi:hypothetical protein